MPLSNTQNALGIGGSGATTVQQNFAGVGKPTNPYDLGTAFRDYYGGMPTHQIVSGMANGQSPTQNAPGSTLANGFGKSVGAPTATPAQAGQMNATMPGVFNGNPANGIPSEEAGFNKAFRGQSAPMGEVPPGSRFQAGALGRHQRTPMMPGAGNATMAPIQPTGAQGAPAPVPAPVDDAAARLAQMQAGLAGTQPGAIAEASTGMAADTREAAAGPIQMRAADAAGAPAENGPAGPVATFTGTNGANIPLTAPLPKNWASMPWAQKSAWLASHTYTAPAAPGGGTTTPPTGTGNYPGQTNTTPTGTTSTGTTTTGTTPPTDAAQAPVDDNGDPLQFKSSSGFQFGPNWFDDANAINVVTDTSYGEPWWKHWWTQGFGLSAAEAKKLGPLPSPDTDGPFPMLTVKMGDADSFTEAVKALGTEQKGLSSLLGKTNDLYAQMLNANWLRQTDPNFDENKYIKLSRRYDISKAALARYGITVEDAGPGNVPGTGDGEPPVTGIGGSDPNSNTSIPTQLPVNNYLDALKNIGSGDFDPIHRLALGELLDNQYQWQVGQTEKQKALNTLAPTEQDLLNNSGISAFRSKALNYGQNPMLSDWDTIRNQYVAGGDKTLKTGMDTLSQNLARRGLGPTAGAGIAANQQRQFAGDQAMGLGQLSLQQQEEKRKEFDRGMGYLQTAGQTDAGIISGSRQNLAQILMGAAPISKSPVEGVANTGTSMLGMQYAKDAQDAAQKLAKDQAAFGWQDGLGLIASMFGGSFGGGAASGV